MWRLRQIFGSVWELVGGSDVDMFWSSQVRTRGGEIHWSVENPHRQCPVFGACAGGRRNNHPARLAGCKPECGGADEFAGAPGGSTGTKNERPGNRAGGQGKFAFSIGNKKSCGPESSSPRSFIGRQHPVHYTFVYTVFPEVTTTPAPALRPAIVSRDTPAPGTVSPVMVCSSRSLLCSSLNM